jgi:hypothetical protein
MGHRLHIPLDGRKVGQLDRSDPRAKLARVTFDGLDVTRGYGPNKHILVIANDVRGWIAVFDPATRIISRHFGDVAITFEPSDGVREAMKGQTS